MMYPEAYDQFVFVDKQDNRVLNLDQELFLNINFGSRIAYKLLNLLHCKIIDFPMFMLAFETLSKPRQ